MKVIKSIIIAAGLTTAAIALVGCSKSTNEESDINRVKYCLNKICSPTHISMTTPDTIDKYIETTSEFHDVVKIGEPALNFMLLEFKGGECSETMEYVMAKACSEILGEDPKDRTWKSGREWYEDYLNKIS